MNRWTFPTDRDTTPARRYISYRHRDRPTAVPQPHCTCVPFTQRRMQQRPKCARAPTRSSPSATEPRHAALAKPGRVCRAVRASELRPTPRAARFTTGQATTPGKRRTRKWPFSAAPACSKPASKMHAHTGTLAGSRCACTGSSSSAGAALVRALSVAPCVDDGLEEDGARHKHAAGRATRHEARPAAWITLHSPQQSLPT